jgi:hypothetical protein
MISEAIIFEAMMIELLLVFVLFFIFSEGELALLVLVFGELALLVLVFVLFFIFSEGELALLVLALLLSGSHDCLLGQLYGT